MWFEVTADKSHISRERQKARDLRQSSWWHSKIAAGLCHYCEKKVGADALTMDHIVPLSRGGVTSKGNVVPACHGCNAEKKLATPVDILFQQLENERKAAQAAEGPSISESPAHDSEK